MDWSVFLTNFGGSLSALGLGAIVIYVAREWITDQLLSTHRFKVFAKQHRFQLFQDRRVNSLMEIHAGFHSLRDLASQYVVNYTCDSPEAAVAFAEVIEQEKQVSHVVGLHSVFLDEDLEERLSALIRKIGVLCREFRGKTVGVHHSKGWDDFPESFALTLSEIAKMCDEAKVQIRQALRSQDGEWK